MQILLVAATSFELEPILSDNATQQFSIDQHTITARITGVGQAAATYAICEALHLQRADLVIQAGIAGSFDDELRLGQPILVAKDVFGDLGMEENNKFTTVFDAGFANGNQPPFKGGWLVNDHPMLAKSSLSVVKAVTVNKISDSTLQQQQLVSVFAPQIESMEGAALHYVCLRQQVAFLQLRTISNKVGDRNKANWQIKLAIDNLCTTFKQLVQAL